MGGGAAGLPARAVSARAGARGRVGPGGTDTVTLGGSGGPEVSAVCLGTMLFGEGTPPAEARRMLALAAEAGVRFFDSAEMYPVPQRAATQGRSEEILGQWMAEESSAPRDAFFVATKVAGPSGQMTWIRDGPQRLDAAAIAKAVDGSLARLRTDYIDLLQLHWPDRYVPMFGDVEYDPRNRYGATVPLEEQLGAMSRLVEQGKVRHFGVSNETPWGLMRLCELARSDSRLPRVLTLQNSFNLLCRSFDAGLAECCLEEDVSFLAYSPLAMGLLTGKYTDGSGGPPGARLNRYRGRYAEAEGRYALRPPVRAAVAAYGDLAAASGMSQLELAVRFCVRHPLVGCMVAGASDAVQLRAVLAAAAAPPLPEDVLREVARIHRLHPSPAP